MPIVLTRDTDLLLDLSRLRSSFTDIPTSPTHASTVAHRAARSFSIPQTLTSSNLQARGSGSSNDRVATKLLRYENSVVESFPRGPCERPLRRRASRPTKDAGTSR
ncbi:hypothetical protein B5807_03241 [Epicoccum nigrum]|uniref:Uncharacterized protein n=1 Tax=Epicoccum nigrum TaxID=105696 RepID=A0A1Y2M5E2_EPING|nr:hypothetical protein B5807_03241 [Epicoccum nigrum]